MKRDEMFHCLSEHMINGVMFHANMADYFRFMGLSGFAQLHEHRYECESHDLRELHRWAICNFDKLIQPMSKSEKSPIPDAMYGYARCDISRGVRQSAVKGAFEAWVKWETDTVNLLQSMYCSCEEADIKRYLQCMIDETRNELGDAVEIHLRLEACDYDMSYIVSIQ
jgi:hypothetical protein